MATVGGLAILAWVLWLMHYEKRTHRLTLWFNVQEFKFYAYYEPKKEK